MYIIADYEIKIMFVRNNCESNDTKKDTRFDPKWKYELTKIVQIRTDLIKEAK